MGNRLEWHLNKRVASIVMSGPFDAESARTVEAEILQVMDQSSQPIHAVIDMRELEQFPPLIDVIRSPYVRHEQRGWLVIIDLKDKPLIRLLTNSLIHGLRLSARTAASLEEGLSILREVDPSLDE